MRLKDAVEVIEKFKEYHQTKDVIYLDEFPEQVKNDFIYFLNGQTIGKRNGRVYAHYHDFNTWLKNHAS